MNLISTAELEQVEACLATLIPASRAAASTGGAALAPLHRAVRGFVLAGGKRVRPQLCLWTFSHSGGDQTLATPALQIACGWELFHAFLLVHDDLIDQAETRRDRLSLHRTLEDAADCCEKAAADLALVAGDLLYTTAMRAFHDADLPPEVYRRQLRLFSRIAMETGLGQALDIAQSQAPLERACEKTVLREYHWKTAAYTFEGPMLSGAILAGAAQPVLSALSRYALALGQAYQLQNDLLDLSRPAHEGCDLVQGKRTVTLVRARAAMECGQRESFDRRLGLIPSANGEAVGIAEELRRELIQLGAARHTRSLITEFLADARSAAADAALPAALGAGLAGLLDALHDQYFVAAE